VRRVSVTGSTGSGKTTFARELASILGAPCVELDALNWGPNWTMVDEALFREKVDAATSGEAWVVDGNYGGRGAQEIVWRRADTLVWLDPPLPVILARLWRRTVGRIRSGEELWGGNRESFRNTFLSRDSLFVWALKTYRRRRRLYPGLLEARACAPGRAPLHARGRRGALARGTTRPRGGAFIGVMTTLVAAHSTAIPRAAAFGVRFDWLALAASAWLLGGLYWDGWAHGYGLPDSFWTVWHAVFYSGYAAAAAVILGATASARPRAASWRAAIPAGYEATVAGVFVFGLGGAFDMAWHTAFGIELGGDALLSPSHLVLGLGIALIVIGPLLAAWRRGSSGGLVAQLPAVLSLTALLSLFTFFSLFAGPYSAVIGTGPKPSEATLVRSLLGMYLFSALVVGLALVALRRGTLPAGSLTVLLGLNGAVMILMRGHAPLEVQLTFMLVAIAAGAIGDVLLWRLRPTDSRPLQLHIFAFALPVVYFALYLGVVVLRVGSGWTVHELTGMVTLCGVVGLLLSFVAAPRGA
jgi:adenylate kinase family enzyme